MSEQQASERTGRIRDVGTFDPRRFITRVGGADYLEVKWRLYWLRLYDQSAEISTELISHENNVAVFKAKIVLSDARGSSTGWGSEGYDDFRDYLEKAETKAIGRALAALGFGTQFTPDFDFSGSTEKVVDAPVRLAQQMGNRAPAQQQRESGVVPPRPQSGGNYGGGGQVQSITDRQVSFIRQMAREKQMTDQQLDAMISEIYNKQSIVNMERREASNLIERLKEYAPPRNAPAEMEPVVNPVTGEIDEIPF